MPNRIEDYEIDRLLAAQGISWHELKRHHPEIREMYPRLWARVEEYLTIKTVTPPTAGGSPSADA